MSIALGRPEQANTPEGLSTAALDLPVQVGTVRRARACGVGTYSENALAPSVGAMS
jgi:hypothetical protein